MLECGFWWLVSGEKCGKCGLLPGWFLGDRLKTGRSERNAGVLRCAQNDKQRQRQPRQQRQQQLQQQLQRQLQRQQQRQQQRLRQRQQQVLRLARHGGGVGD